MQTSYHDIRHPKAHHSYRSFTHPSRRMTFDPSWLRYALSHHISLHQRIAIRRDDASNTFAITCKHLITNTPTKHTNANSHNPTPIHMRHSTIAHSAPYYATYAIHTPYTYYHTCLRTLQKAPSNQQPPLGNIQSHTQNFVSQTPDLPK